MKPNQHYLSPDMRKRIVKLTEEGYTQSEVARIMKVNTSTVSRTCKNFEERGHCKNAVKTGRKKKTSEHLDRLILREVKKNCFASASEVKQNLNLNISTQTVRRRFKNAGLNSRQVTRKPLISAKNRKARTEFAREHLNWTAEQ